MYPVRVGWDTYLMHFAASELKMNWVRYFGYHQERQKGSLTQAPGSGVQSKLRAATVAQMDSLWKAYKESPERLTEILRPDTRLQKEIDSDAERLRKLL
jgi:hypothetical protein